MAVICRASRKKLDRRGSVYKRSRGGDVWSLCYVPAAEQLRSCCLVPSVSQCRKVAAALLQSLGQQRVKNHGQGSVWDSGKHFDSRGLLEKDDFSLPWFFAFPAGSCCSGEQCQFSFLTVRMNDRLSPQIYFSPAQ